MRVAVVKVTWVPSVSQDVVSQSVLVRNETLGEDILAQELSPNITEVTFDVPEKTDTSVSVVVSDGTFNSDPALLVINIGDLTGPLAVTGLAYEILEVVDREEV